MQQPETRSAAQRVAFQGELGAFSEEAVVRYFGANAVPLPKRSFADVTAAVRSRETAYGLLPIENTTVGAVAAAYDQLDQPDLHIVGEVICPVRHCLLALPGTSLSDVRRALSHPVALGQCANFFLRHPGIEPVATYDTAGAAQQVAAAADPHTAAVASQRAADRYGLAVLAADIHDRADNQTRFLVISRTPEIPAPAGEHKTALLLETRNESGGLVNALLPFANRGLNLIRLESRPGDVAWTYRFFLEIDGSPVEPGMRAALDEVESKALKVRVLGVFSRALDDAP